MSNTTDTTSIEAYKKSAAAIATLIDETRPVIECLQALRSLESNNEVAIEALLGVPELNRIRLGWELFEVLTEGEGIDSESMLLEAIGVEDYLLARDAFWCHGD